MVESAPSVIKKATSKGENEGQGQAVFAARLGDRLERMKCLIRLG